MENRFYTAFDTENLDGPRDSDFRTPFQADRDRILYTTAFRRLQNKTQVFLAGEYDFYRTRLTHSLEVAQIGRSICRYLLHRGEFLTPDFFVDADLVEAICLTHDLGHPPFGHAGERALNRLMAKHGGFEGNAQTLRIVTETIYSGRGRNKGMNPTRAFLDGILKYKSLHREFDNPLNHFIYDEQTRFLEFVWNGNDGFAALAAGDERNYFRSIECQIMDWSDDTAYSLNDIVDGVRAGFITPEKIENWAGEQPLNERETAYIEQLLIVIRDDGIEARFGSKIGKFLQGCRLRPRAENFMSPQTNRYRFELAIDEEVREEADLYSRLANDIVFLSPQLQHLEYKGNFLLRRMFAALVDAVQSETNGHGIDFLPTELSRNLKDIPNERACMRLLCDFLSGMTDGYAIRFYKRLFSPDVGLMNETGAI